MRTRHRTGTDTLCQMADLPGVMEGMVTTSASRSGRADRIPERSSADELQAARIMEYMDRGSSSA